MEIEDGKLMVTFAQRSRNSILKEAHLDRPTPPILWCGGLRLHMIVP